jgi:hypothetical protein
MKKFLSYILIFIISFGLFGLVPIKQVRADTDLDANGAPYGICSFTNGTPATHLTSATCLGNTNVQGWVADTGTCVFHRLSYNSCKSPIGGQSSPPASASDPDGTKTQAYGDCTVTGSTSTATFCNENKGGDKNPGTFTPVYVGTPPIAGGQMCTGQIGTPPGCDANVNAPGSTCVVTKGLANAIVGYLSYSNPLDAFGLLNNTYEQDCQNVHGTFAGNGASAQTCTLSGVSPQTCANYSGGTWSTTSIYVPPGQTPGTMAQQPLNTYTLLAPLPCPGGSVGCSGQLTTLDVSGTNSLGTYLNLIIKIFIGICAVLALIMVVMGGIEYMTSDLISSKEAGKERIRDALLGLVLALAAWTLLYTINPNLLQTNINIPAAAADFVDVDVPQTPVNGKYSTGAAVGSPWNDQTAGPIPTLPSGVSINAAQCTTVGQIGCTSTRGLNLSAVNSLLASCPSCAPLVISGGTEYWLHGTSASGNTSHGPNSSTVDLRTSNALTNYIMTGNPATPPPTAPIYFHRYTQYGNFLYENDHWHLGS